MKFIANAKYKFKNAEARAAFESRLEANVQIAKAIEKTGGIFMVRQSSYGARDRWEIVSDTGSLVCGQNGNEYGYYLFNHEREFFELYAEPTPEDIPFQITAMEVGIIVKDVLKKLEVDDIDTAQLTAEDIQQLVVTKSIEYRTNL